MDVLYDSQAENSRVVSVDAQEGKVTLERHAAYRTVISTKDMIDSDPMLKPLVDRTEMTIWMGPDKHTIHRWCVLSRHDALMTRMQRGKAEYNLAMVRPDDGEKESYTTEGSVKNMPVTADFTGWELGRAFISYTRACSPNPILGYINSYAWLVYSTMIWPLLYRQPLDTWVASSGKVVLLDDACHPMLSQRDALANHNAFHLEDVPRQQERDHRMRAAMEAALNEGQDTSAAELDGNSNMWADRKKSESQSNYDAGGGGPRRSSSGIFSTS
ncbi:hypothetical protein B0H14DRAFT_2868506 [Mycena olivaceomarginata]|nr:hypothetical protein B0H14DRAFT_2868506 [Mycena olivaceomarginata]